MSVSVSFKAYVQEQFADPKRLKARPMFGGVGLSWETTFFAVIDDDTVFFKVDAETRPAFEQAGSGPFDPFKNGKPMRGYYELPPEILEDREQLAVWRATAVAVSRRAPSPKRRAPSAEPRVPKK